MWATGRDILPVPSEPKILSGPLMTLSILPRGQVDGAFSPCPGFIGGETGDTAGADHGAYRTVSEEGTAETRGSFQQVASVPGK